jgi:hypothetical protein
MVSANETVQRHALITNIDDVVHLHAARVVDMLIVRLPHSLWDDEDDLRQILHMTAILGIQRSINALIESHYAGTPDTSAPIHDASPQVAAARAAAPKLAHIEQSDIDSWLFAHNCVVGASQQPPALLRAWVISQAACTACCTDTHAHFDVTNLQYVEYPIEWNPYGVTSSDMGRAEIQYGRPPNKAAYLLVGDLLYHQPTMYWFHQPDADPRVVTSIFQTASLRRHMSVEMLAVILSSAVHMAVERHCHTLGECIQAYEQRQGNFTRQDLIDMADVVARIGFRDARRPLSERPWVPRALSSGGSAASSHSLVRSTIWYEGDHDGATAVADTFIRSEGVVAVTIHEKTFPDTYRPPGYELHVLRTAKTPPLPDSGRLTSEHALPPLPLLPNTY